MIKSTCTLLSALSNSGDANDGTIDPGADTKVMLAYGPNQDNAKLKHSFAKTITVNLATGAGR